MRNGVMAAVLMLVAGCSAMGSPSSSSVKAPPLDQQACQQQGGRWQAIGRAQRWVCLVDYADAGKACSDAAQCQGRCLLEDVDVPAGQPANGVCQRDASQAFGCRQPVQNGVAGSVVCID